MKLQVENQQKEVQTIEELPNTQQTSQIRSKFNELYSDWIQPIQANLPQIRQNLMRRGILYDQLLPYSDFYFDVERVIPCLDFYRLHAKIGHFKLIINVAKQQSYSQFQKQPNSLGINKNIYFANVRGRQLCFKTFSFQTEKQFRKKFIRAAKQWSILKICSALECSPNIYNYLGFDIMIYNDCIQFPLQKGNQIKQLSHQQINKLKQQLRLMHQFKIIHCDVKPQNLTFSNHFGKPVFIDFGFSQIAKQDVGFKTYSSFKGTPNFCSSEMLDLIMGNKGYVDLYFNDVYSLQQTIKSLSKTQLFAEYFNQYQKQDYQIKINKIDQSSFIFNAVQFHYINNNLFQLKESFQTFIQVNQQNIRKVLKFIKNVVNYVFLPKFFYQYLDSFKKLAQYKQMQQKIQSSAQLLHFKKEKQGQMIVKAQKLIDLANIPLLSSSQQFIDGEQLINFQHYFAMILNIAKVQQETASHFVAIIFYCVRFDQKNIEFSKKLQIAKKVNPLLSTFLKNKRKQISGYQIINQSNIEIKQMKILIRHILYFCLISKHSKWIDEHIFDVFQQLIILNDDVSSLSKPFFTYISQNQHSFDLILVTLQLIRLQKSIQMIKIQPFAISLDLHSKFKQFIQEIFTRQKSLRKTQNYQTKLIDRCMEHTFCNKKILTPQICFSFEQQDLKQINNPNIRKHLYYQLTFQKIKTFYQLGKHSQILKIIQIVKKSVDIHNIDFMSRARIMIDLMYYSYNETAFYSYYNHIASVINCPQIYSHFNSEKYLFKYNQTFYQKIDKLIQRLPLLVSDKMSCEILKILLNTTIKDVSSNYELKSKVLQLYNEYRKLQHSIKQYKQICIQMYLDIFYKLQVQFNFFLLLPQTKQLFDKSKNQSLKQIDQIPIETYIPLQNFELIEFKLFLYQYYHCLVNRNQERISFFLDKLIELCEQISLIYLIEEFVKILLYVSVLWKREQIMVYSATKLFQFFKSYNQFTFYLLPINQHYTQTTFHIFARHNKVYFLQMMVNLTKLLSQNPTHATKSYFISFLDVINQFLKKDYQFGYLIHYSKYLKDYPSNILHENPYLLIFCIYSLYHQNKSQQLKLLKIFAVYCDFLSIYARKKLLEKYFSIFVSLSKGLSKQQRINVFRWAKNYINKLQRKKEIKKIVKTLKKSIFDEHLKRKIQLLRKKLDYY